MRATVAVVLTSPCCLSKPFCQSRHSHCYSSSHLYVSGICPESRRGWFTANGYLRSWYVSVSVHLPRLYSGRSFWTTAIAGLTSRTDLDSGLWSPTTCTRDSLGEVTGNQYSSISPCSCSRARRLARMLPAVLCGTRPFRATVFPPERILPLLPSI